MKPLNKRVHPTNSIQADEDIPQTLRISFAPASSEPILTFDGQTELKGVDVKNIPTPLQSVFNHPCLWFKVTGEAKGNQIPVESVIKVQDVGSGRCSLDTILAGDGWNYWVFTKHGFALHVHFEVEKPMDTGTMVPCKILEVWVSTMLV